MQMNERNGAREQSSAEQANESAVRANGFLVAQYIRLDSWLFWTTVEWDRRYRRNTVQESFKSSTIDLH